VSRICRICHPVQYPFV